MASIAGIYGAGIGLRPVHVSAFLENRPALSWCEVITDNYLSATESELQLLDRVRVDYSLSLHGVGMSLGSADSLDLNYLGQVKQLVDRFQPTLVSEHLCWTSLGGSHLHDLLPLPYTEDVARHLAEKIEAAQCFLGREILVENVSSYLTYRESTLSEWEFVAQVANQSGCGVLLDVSNIVVSTTNHGIDPIHYVSGAGALPVKEIHLGGFQVREGYLLDSHDSPIDSRAWNLYRAVIEILGEIPTLIEWDNELPALERIVLEAQNAQQVLDNYAAFST